MKFFIPDKLYFRIGEWQLCAACPPMCCASGKRVPATEAGKKQHRPAHVPQTDVESVLRIKQLLYEQGFTIVGARQQLRSELKTDKGQAAIPFPRSRRRVADHSAGLAGDFEFALDPQDGLVIPQSIITFVRTPGCYLVRHS